MVEVTIKFNIKTILIQLMFLNQEEEEEEEDDVFKLSSGILK